MWALIRASSIESSTGPSGSDDQRVINHLSINGTGHSQSLPTANCTS